VAEPYTHAASGTLILEGGAMRGVFTTGVLDAFMEKGYYFPVIAAISAGTMQALCYLSRQMGRNRRVNLTYADDHRYMGLRHLIRGGSYFNFSFLFGELARELDPFDQKTFESSSQTMYALITDCEKGQTHYLSNKEMDFNSFLTVCQASCSIPFFSKPVYVNHKPYVDGGLGMPLAPLPEELPFPAEKPVYILTRDATYRKRILSGVEHRLLQMTLGRKWPVLAERMYTIPPRYNAKIDELQQREKEGRVFIIRPSHPTTVSRVEKDTSKLKELYEDGLSEGRRRFDELMRWIHE
jgi:predicted patatin/cPLA2 family phospholipase